MTLSYKDTVRLIDPVDPKDFGLIGTVNRFSVNQGGTECYISVDVVTAPKGSFFEAGNYISGSFLSRWEKVPVTECLFPLTEQETHYLRTGQDWSGDHWDTE